MPTPGIHLRDDTALPRSAEVVIIGGGIVGIATAFFLRQRGVEAVVFEAASDIGQRTTAMSAHCIRAQFSERDNIRMMAESLAFYERFGEHCGGHGIELCQQGYLFASSDPGDLPSFRERVERQRAAGLDDVELLDGSEVRRRFPWLSEEIAVATWRERDGWIDSHRAVRGMAAACGVPIYAGVRVERIDVRGGRVTGLATTAGRVATSDVVLAAGPFSRALSPEPLPLSLLRRHRLIVHPSPMIPRDGPVTIDANTGAHWRPHRGGALMAWAQPAEDTEATWPVPVDPAFVDLILRGERGVARLAPFWAELAPSLRANDFLLTAGQYTMTPDHRPLIGRAPETAGLWLHTGYSGHGIMGAPAGARLLADLVVRPQNTDNAFAPDRFANTERAPDVEHVVI